MELMEEGNLMDRVQILLQRDLDYYEKNQTVLQENICLGAVGGPFDFPRYASFAAVKLVQWWEEEFVSCFQHKSGLMEGSASLESGGGEEAIKQGVPPGELVSLVQQSAERLLEHLHTLSQEALDHADLGVLTATLGAAALAKNALACFNETLKKETKGPNALSLHQASRLMHEMVEALAERLLDLHTRLTALYLLQDADSLHWESEHAFFEGLRGSFTVQMWWFYMQGTRADLWNTVPPKTAQRVFAGMLNESLTILTARYSQAKPSRARAAQLVTDIANIVVCVRYLLPSICTNGSELLGLGGTASKATRDIHAKCHDLLCTLLCRGCPLGTLYKVLRKGLNSAAVFHSRPVESRALWLVLVSPRLFPGGCDSPAPTVSARTAVALELSVLVAQPEACWPQLLRVLVMRNCLTINLMLRQLLRVKEAHAVPFTDEQIKPCAGFLCGATAGCWVEGAAVTPSQVTHALVLTLVTACGEPEGGGSQSLSAGLAPLLQDCSSDWSSLDQRQVWAEQCRPAWLAALVTLAKHALQPLPAAVSSIQQLWQGLELLADTLPPGILITARLLDDVLPADVCPFGGCTLIQILAAAVYSLLVETGGDAAMQLAEKWCNVRAAAAAHQKYAHNIVHAATERLAELEELSVGSAPAELDEVPQLGEVLASSLLLTPHGRTAVKILYKFVQHQASWLLAELASGAPQHSAPPLLRVPAERPSPVPLLQAMFHIGERNFDELLTGAWHLDWPSLLHTPLGMERTEMLEQLSKRPEFREQHLLNDHDAKVVATLTALFTSPSAENSAPDESAPSHPRRVH